MSPNTKRIISKRIEVYATPILQPTTPVARLTTGLAIYAYLPMNACRLPQPSPADLILITDASGESPLTPITGGATLQLTHTEGHYHMDHHTGHTTYGASSHRELEAMANNITKISRTYAPTSRTSSGSGSRFEVWGLILRVLDAFWPQRATWSGQVISSPPGPSGGPSKTHLLPGGEVPRVHRAWSPVPPRLPQFATPWSVHQFAAVAAGAYPLRRPPNAWSPTYRQRPPPAGGLVYSPRTRAPLRGAPHSTIPRPTMARQRDGHHAQPKGRPTGGSRGPHYPAQIGQGRPSAGGQSPVPRPGPNHLGAGGLPTGTGQALPEPVHQAPLAVYGGRALDLSHPHRPHTSQDRPRHADKPLPRPQHPLPCG